MSSKQTQQSEIGMVGLGVMGRNFVLNMADHGFAVAGYDKDPKQVEALSQESEKRDVHGATDVQEFIALLRKPRAIMMLVPAGPPVDSVIKDLLPYLE
ncbi:MAG: NAD(P)-binding domain-containing protein, partial [Verrucomicrobiota bacterium]|nr:NAD(P)-binding domain-containing protein [Verrucomicrobiota bacterium]